ncbi:MAG: lysophospholipid acyltransferase family protein [Saprospiraceae bacterium]
MRYLRVIWRLLFFVAYTARIVAEVYWRRVCLRQDTARIMAVRQRWAVRLLYGMGIRISVEGSPPAVPCILMSNHRSYLDPIILLRDVYAYPVAKAELADWPLIGKGARWAGILYVQREASNSRVTILKAVADVVLGEGFSVILFPEGTTSDLDGILPFKKGAFRAAARWSIPVAPVALHFEDKRDFWVGDATFGGHAWERFQEPTIRVRVSYGPLLRNDDGEALELAVREWIEGALARE